MFVDDLLIGSESAEGLYNSLEKLNYYYTKWQLSYTEDNKFSTTNKKNNNNFFINGSILEKVLQYKYLGKIIEASDKFHSSHIEL